MASEEDTSTRTIASVAAVIALIALLLIGVDSTRQGLIAQYVGTAKAVAGYNDAKLVESIDALNTRITALETQAAASPAPAAAPPAAPAEAPAAAPPE